MRVIWIARAGKLVEEIVVPKISHEERGIVPKDSQRENFETFKPKKQIPSKVIRLIQQEQIHKEVMLIYNALKKLGFRVNPLIEEEKYLEAAVNKFQEKKKLFKYIIKSYLNDKNLYVFNTSQTKRDFIGRILKKIVEGKGRGSYGGQRLYGIFKRRKTD